MTDLERVLLIDHYDSFTYTIKGYFETLRVAVEVIQYDDPRLMDLANFMPTMLVFSPGPGKPDEVPQTLDLIKRYHRDYPMLGICLGHQCMAQVFGARVVHASEVMHGKQSMIYHTGGGLFSEIPSPFSVTRYHSLVVDPETLPASIDVTAWTFDRYNQPVIMGFSHKTYPLFGVQYHPEAVLSEHGHLLFSHFLTYAKAWRNSLANRS